MPPRTARRSTATASSATGRSSVRRRQSNAPRSCLALGAAALRRSAPPPRSGALHSARASSLAPFRAPGHRRAVNRAYTPLPLDADVDADAPAPRDRPRRRAAILDPQRAVREVAQVLPQIDAERLRQVAWAAAEMVDVDVRGFGP